MARSTASATSGSFREAGLARMVQPSVPHTTSLQKATAASTKAAGSGAGQGRLGHLPEERLHVEADVVGAPGRHAADEGPGQRVGGAATELLGLGMRGDESVVAAARAPG